jgi:hypothetical protein
MDRTVIYAWKEHNKWGQFLDPGFKIGPNIPKMHGAMQKERDIPPSRNICGICRYRFGLSVRI